MNNNCCNCENYPGRGEVCSRSGNRLDKVINNSCGLFGTAVYTEVEVIQPGEPLFPPSVMVELIKKGPTGKVSVIERQPKDSPRGIDLVLQAMKLQKEKGRDCPYSLRYSE